MSFLDRLGLDRHTALLVTLLANVTACAVWINLRHAAEADWQARADLEAKLNATGRVVYAIKDVQEGQEIPRSALVEREIPQMRMPMDAITSVDLLVGRTAKYGIEAGAIVSQHDIAAQGWSDYENRLPPGMRAVSFQVDDTAATSGLILPDSFIDIYASAGSGAQTNTVPILSHAKVLAVGSALSKYEYEQLR